MGLREKKKQQTARRIADTALRLFAKHGFDAVTISEIAEASDVARGTLFSYFPTKESLVVAAVGDDDPAAIVSARPVGMSAIEALRRHYRKFAVNPGLGAGSNLLPILRVITENPALSSAVNRLYDQQRDALAKVLASEASDSENGLIPEVVAAQICATILAIKSNFFRRLAAGEDLQQAAAQLPSDLDTAFALLKRGIGTLYRKGS